MVRNDARARLARRHHVFVACARRRSLLPEGCADACRGSRCALLLGVLFAVGGLERVGLLKAFAIQLSSLVPSDALVAILLGFASAVVDNVPLVAATQGMYDLTAHPPNDPLWNLITYCAATGGSLLVIGSAAGVAFMGMERNVSFGWYVQKAAPAALVGYFAGVGGILAQQALGLAIK